MTPIRKGQDRVGRLSRREDADSSTTLHTYAPHLPVQVAQAVPSETLQMEPPARDNVQAWP